MILKPYQRLFEQTEISEEVKQDLGSYLKELFPVFDNPRYFWNESEIADFVLETLKPQFRKEDPKKLLAQFRNRSTSPKVVDKYYAMLQQGIEFDPVLVSGDEFIDGGHRVQAYARAGKLIPVLDIKSIIEHDWDKEVRAEFGLKESYIDYEQEELEREEANGVSAQELKSAFEQATPQKLSDKIWSQLNNTDSWELAEGDFARGQELADEYGKDWDWALKSVKSGEYNPPLIYKKDGHYQLVAGNTRLMAAQALGIRPQVLIAELN